jgi:hypothetical protein
MEKKEIGQGVIYLVSLGRRYPEFITLRDEVNDKALNRRASLKSRSAAEESNLKIPDKVTEP